MCLLLIFETLYFYESLISPNHKTNSKPNPNLNREKTFLWGNCLVTPQTLKLTLTLTQIPTLTGGGNFPRGAIVPIPFLSNK